MYKRKDARHDAGGVKTVVNGIAIISMTAE
jgi:hypothetical protein